ncbi:hypothetical protein D7Y09_15770 [bacterium 1XD42-1]|nr:GPW/gp25 family protein [Oscillospiraceae bacterium]RKJ44747.1 hypothetical protein D7X25_24785 [bacterium 1XD42-8]RKJ61444.1 hypothetical protein D7Y09_15770 [bacterium 1XD42-1]
MFQRFLKFNVTDPVESVLQNIAVILSTPKGSVPMYRDFGISVDILDRPIPVAKAMMTADIKEAIEQWEPRVTFISVDFMEDELNGRLIPMVEVEINP